MWILQWIINTSTEIIPKCLQDDVYTSIEILDEVKINLCCSKISSARFSAFRIRALSRICDQIGCLLPLPNETQKFLQIWETKKGNGQRVYLTEQYVAVTPPKTILAEFIRLCQQQHDYSRFAKTLLYAEVPTYFTWNKSKRTWEQKKCSSCSIPRIF